MGIGDKQVVRFHYTLRDATGESIETSCGGEPMMYLHGFHNIIPGLEAEMAGKNPGDVFSITVPPEQAYGQRQENALQRIAVKHLHGSAHWKPGMVGWVETEHGPQQVRILKIGKFMADVDLNHPLAGLTLVFDVEIVDVRAGTEDEIKHGHAHGVGGHHH